MNFGLHSSEVERLCQQLMQNRHLIANVVITLRPRHIFEVNREMNTYGFDYIDAR